MGLQLRNFPAQTPETSTTNTTSSTSQTCTLNSSPRATGAGVNTGAGTTRPKTAAELEADRLYEEALEEAYAQREGGA